jgi:hypothetical protein
MFNDMDFHPVCLNTIFFYTFHSVMSLFKSMQDKSCRQCWSNALHCVYSVYCCWHLCSRLLQEYTCWARHDYVHMTVFKHCWMDFCLVWFWGKHWILLGFLCFVGQTFRFWRIVMPSSLGWSVFQVCQDCFSCLSRLALVDIWRW